MLYTFLSSIRRFYLDAKLIKLSRFFFILIFVTHENRKCLSRSEIYATFRIFSYFYFDSSEILILTFPNLSWLFSLSIQCFSPGAKFPDPRSFRFYSENGLKYRCSSSWDRAKRVKIIFILLVWDPIRKRNRNPGCWLEKERERGRENDGTRTAWDAHVHSQGRSGAINRSGRFISRRAATAATRFRGCSREDLVPNEQLLSTVSSRFPFRSFLRKAGDTRHR